MFGQELDSMTASAPLMPSQTNEGTPQFYPRAGNTVASLRPVNGAKSSERLVTEGLTTKPEPTEEVIERAKTFAAAVLENADLIDEHLAAQGEQLNRAKVLEIATLPSVEFHTKDANAVLPPHSGEKLVVVEDDFVTREEFQKLKDGFNDSMSEVANMLLDLQTANNNLEERIKKYNSRGGHRI